MNLPNVVYNTGLARQEEWGLQARVGSMVNPVPTNKNSICNSGLGHLRTVDKALNLTSRTTKRNKIIAKT